MKRCTPSLVPIFCVFFSTALPIGILAADNLPGQLILRAKVRDFKEMNPTDTVGTHPHFNTQNACSAQELGVNTVEATLDTAESADGGVYAGDNRGPMLMSPMTSTLARCYDPPERFSDWYTDKPGVNRSFFVDLSFKLDTATGLYHFKDDNFFPLDAGKPYSKINPADPDPFGNLQTGVVDGRDLTLHNYGFTMELHTFFTYTQGKKQVFDFQGDDDIWVFLNGKRVLDLGGVHQTQKGSVDLDSAMIGLGLEDGKSYPMDFFFAERHTASSSCLITTNIDLSASPVALRTPPVARFRTPEGASPVAFYDRSGRLVRVAVPAELRAQGMAPGVYFWKSSTAGKSLAASGMMILP